MTEQETKKLMNTSVWNFNNNPEKEETFLKLYNSYLIYVESFLH